MRSFKIAGALIAVVAFTCLAIASSASAEITLWKFLGVKAGTHFSGKSGKATLQVKGSGTITCKESKTNEKESEITEPEENPTLTLAILVFSGCKAFGLAAESLGEASGTIRTHLHAHNCVLENGNPGTIIEPLPIHIDIPSTGLLILVEGSFVAEAVPVGAQPTKTWELVVSQKEGVQGIEKCKGGTALSLVSSVDGEAFTQSGEEAKEGSLEYAKAFEVTL